MKIFEVYTVTSRRSKKPIHFARYKVAVAVANQYLEGADNCSIEKQSLVIFDNCAQFHEFFPHLVK